MTDRSAPTTAPTDTGVAAAVPTATRVSDATGLPDDPRQRLDRLIAAFDGQIERPTLTPLYRLGLGAVAITMVLLPLVYIALACATAWGTWQLAASLLESDVRGRGMVFGLLTIVVVGGIVVFFMFKPLFAPKAPAPEPFTLDPDAEPVLHGFVDHLCGVVGAPRPRRIDVDCQVNASAGFRRGLVSFLGKDLKLTIGMPLVAGMNLRQFTGVLAHEFGHFSQGTGMRLTYVIRTVNHWFARVVYERDAWDERLVAWSRGGDVRVKAVVGVTRVAVWITRKILWVLMILGHAVSCFALRQMEYDADAYETQVAGTPVFETTSLRIPQLGVGSQAAHRHLGELWSDRRLCDNFPALIVGQVGAFDAQVTQKIREHTLNQKTGSLDTHPSDADRIAASKRIDAPGVFAIDAPASVLFADFEGLCRAATRRYYDNMIGEQWNSARLEPADALLAGSRAEADVSRAAMEVFGPIVMPNRPLRPVAATIAPPDESQPDAAARLAELIERMNAAAHDASDSARASDVADDKALELEQKIGIEECGVGTGSANFRLKAKSEIDALRRQLAETEARRDAAAQAYDDYCVQGAQRIDLGLRLLRDPRVADTVDDVEALVGRCQTMLTGVNEIVTQRPLIDRLRTQLLKVHGALNKHNEDPNAHGKMVGPIQAQTRELAATVVALQHALDSPYPFDHAAGDWSLGRYVVEQAPNGEDIGQTLGAASDAIGRSAEAYMRMLAYLAAAARTVERVLVPDAAPCPLLQTPDEEAEAAGDAPAVTA